MSESAPLPAKHRRRTPDLFAIRIFLVLVPRQDHQVEDVDVATVGFCPIRQDGDERGESHEHARDLCDREQSVDVTGRVH